MSAAPQRKKRKSTPNTKTNPKKTQIKSQQPSKEEGCGDPLSEVSFDISYQDKEGKVIKMKISGYIVNIAAFFHLNWDNLSVFSVCFNGWASFNKRRFGAGTMRIVGLGDIPYYSGDYETDCSRFLQDQGYISLNAYYESHGMGKDGTLTPNSDLPSFWYPVQFLANLLFDSGRVVSIGASNEYVARHGASLLVAALQKYEGMHGASMSDYRTVNIVITFHLGFRVDLMELADTEKGFISFQREAFPAVIIHSETKITLLVNETGKCILTGAASEEELGLFLKQHFSLLYTHGYRMHAGKKIVFKRKREVVEEKRQTSIVKPLQATKKLNVSDDAGTLTLIPATTTLQYNELNQNEGRWCVAQNNNVSSKGSNNANSSLGDRHYILSSDKVSEALKTENAAKRLTSSLVTKSDSLKPTHSDTKSKIDQMLVQILSKISDVDQEMSFEEGLRKKLYDINDDPELKLQHALVDLQKQMILQDEELGMYKINSSNTINTQS